MKSKRAKGLGGLAVIIIIAIGLLGGTAAGYTFRKDIQKAIKGKTELEQQEEEHQQEIESVKLGHTKFELQGTTTAVDTSGSKINVKVKVPSDAIKELKELEVPITIDVNTSIKFGSETLEIAGIPINSKIHISGTISDDGLLAEKIVVQKEEDDDLVKNGNEFGVNGIVVSLASGSLEVEVTAADKGQKKNIGKTITISVSTLTNIEKDEQPIVLADIVVGDKIEISGIFKANSYTAVKIEVEDPEVEEAEDEAETTTKSNGASNAKNKDSDEEEVEDE